MKDSGERRSSGSRPPFEVRVQTHSGRAKVQGPKGELPLDLLESLHRLELDVLPYIHVLGQRGLDATLHSAQQYIERYLAEMQPRNPMERMLAVQMLWQTARIGRLLSLPPQSGVEALRAVNQAIDSAMNVSRRQAMAWNALKNPRPVQFVKAGQLNVAGQQVVSNPAPPSTGGGPAAAPPEASPGAVSANEQGFTNAEEAPPPALPPVIPGLDGPPSIRRPREAVDAVHGPKNGRRETTSEPKRPQARAANSKRHRA